MTCDTCGINIKTQDGFTFSCGDGFNCMICSTIKMKRGLKYLEGNKYKKNKGWKTLQKRIPRAKVRRSVRAMEDKRQN